MQSGNKDGGSFLIKRLVNILELADFNCGIPRMDAFLHGDLALSIANHFCEAYSVISDGQVIAFFALSFDSLSLDDEDKNDAKFVFNVNDEYADSFWYKSSYPALEIAYLAVKENYQRMGIGSFIVEEIATLAESQTIAGCQFLTVDALVITDNISPYSAVGFYSKAGFVSCEYPDPSKETCRMYRALHL